MTYFSDTYLPWFTLREVSGIGNILKKELIRCLGCPDKILSAPPGTLGSVRGMTSSRVAAIQNHSNALESAKAELTRIQKFGNISILTLTDPDYPVLLKEIPDSPMVLTYQGSLFAQAPCIAIVGSRKATRYGEDTARTLAAGLSQRGFTIISGMAQGIDTCAHQGALSQSGNTWAVMGSGLARIYPRQNTALHSQIKTRGAVISEFNVDAAPLARHFPVRNRIIAGIACGTIVVEAAPRSGSLITARLAGEYNREVFAVPGSIRSVQSRGTHELIRQGVHLVETQEDIINELYQFVHPEPGTHVPVVLSPQGKKKQPIMDKAEALVYNSLDPYPRHIDEIIEAAGLESSRVTAILTDMELSGRIRRHPGNFFSLSEE